MKIIALGSGSAFTMDNYQTNFLIITDLDYKILFDCGGDCRFALKNSGYTYRDITGVFVSHLHGDHVGGLEWLGFSKYFDPNDVAPALYISESLVQPLWNNTLSGGMGSLQGKITVIDDYFQVYPLKQNESITWWDDENIVLQPVQTCHVMNGYYLVPSFGLLIRYKNKTIFITGDTQYAPEQINHFYEMADIIFHDCELLYTKDGEPIYSTVHAHYDRLKSLPEEIKNKMWLVHYQDIIPITCNSKKDGFLGFVKKGQIFDF